MRNQEITNNNKLTPDQQRVKNQALILEQEILGTVLNIIRKTENPAHIANVIKDLQQDFIGYFDSCDYDYLRDGNIIFTEFQSIFNSLAVAEQEALEKLQEKNKQRYDRISIKMKL